MQRILHNKCFLCPLLNSFPTGDRQDRLLDRKTKGNVGVGQGWPGDNGNEGRRKNIWGSRVTETRDSIEGPCRGNAATYDQRLLSLSTHGGSEQKGDLFQWERGWVPRRGLEACLPALSTAMCPTVVQSLSSLTIKGDLHFLWALDNISTSNFWI